MQLRVAFSSALRLFRSRKGLSQLDLGKGLDRSHISRLESGRHSPTLEASESVAQSMDVDPLSLLIVTYAIKQGATPREILERVSDELGSQALLDQVMSVDIPAPAHPQSAKALKTNIAVQALKSRGLSREQIAQELGVSRSSVNRHWNNPAH